MNDPQNFHLPVTPIGLSDEQMDLFMELARKCFAVVQQQSEPSPGLRFAHPDDNGDELLAAQKSSPDPP